MLNWANQFNICCFLDNNNYPSEHNSYECLLAVGAINEYCVSVCSNADIDALQLFTSKANDWLFGHISYDFKNAIHLLSTNKNTKLDFPEIFLFQPETIITLTGKNVIIETVMLDVEKIFNTINSIEIGSISTHAISIKMQPKIAKDSYIETIEKIKQHIQQGDCYELSFCQEFFAENAVINPYDIYVRLNTISPTPFSCFYKLHHNYLLCASPERFIKKDGNKLISQPIKGTIQRDITNTQKDEALKNTLLTNQKEISENVMIVDLVRNDLSKIADTASVKVDELFGIYSFPQVHQMISTVSATVNDDISFADVLKALFPMGSMTGAPKYKVMQLIEEYEQSKRGIYSGSVGYISPQNNFDFNVVIRSMMYNANEQYLSYQVGSAITHYCNAEDEYNECLLKAQAMEAVLKK